MNGQVVRTIGKTTVGSIDLMKSVDSKFEIVRSVEKALKEAVKSNKKAQSTITTAVPETIKSIEVFDESIRHSKQASSSSSSSSPSSSSSSSSPPSSTSSLSSIRALAKNLIKKI